MKSHGWLLALTLGLGLFACGRSHVGEPDIPDAASSDALPDGMLGPTCGEELGSASPRTPLCSATCACPPVNDPSDPGYANDRVTCTGLDAAHELGLCTFVVTDGAPTCEASSFWAIEEQWLFEDDEPACLVLLDDEGREPSPSYGVRTFAEACRQYRERYPGHVECHDGSWRVVP